MFESTSSLMRGVGLSPHLGFWGWGQFFFILFCLGGGGGFTLIS